MYNVFPNFINVFYSILFSFSYNVLAESEMEPRILAGIKASNRSALSYMASIGVDQNHICGGALIKLDKVLSSASCCTKEIGTENVALLSVKVGCLDLRDPTTYTEVSAVKEIHIHPEYNRTVHRNDLILLLTLSEFVQNIHVKPINLPRTRHIYYSDCIVAGWGKSNLKFHFYSKDLHYGIVDISEDNECRQNIKAYNIDPEHLICTNGSARPTQFDDGSPLACGNTLVGIVTYTEDYRNKKSPGVYLEVFPYLEWIEGGSTKLKACFLIILCSPFVAIIILTLV